MTDTARISSRLALIGTLLMLVLVNVSAYLRLSAAGLGCEPWPACHAQAAPTAQSGERQPHPLARLVHRVLAGTVGVVVLLVAFVDLTGRGRHPRFLGRSLLLVALTIALASLGRVTPGATSLAVALGNLLGGAALAALLWWTALDKPASQIAFAGEPAGRLRSARVRGLAYTTLVLVIIQFVLGALLSTTAGATACTTLPLCGEGASTGTAILHLAHRLLALALVIAAGTLALALLRGGIQARWCAIALGVLLVLQAAAGAGTVIFGFPLWLALAHNIGGVLLLLAAVAATRV